MWFFSNNFRTSFYYGETYDAIPKSMGIWYTKEKIMVLYPGTFDLQWKKTDGTKPKKWKFLNYSYRFLITMEKNYGNTPKTIVLYRKLWDLIYYEKNYSTLKKLWYRTLWTVIYYEKKLFYGKTLIQWGKIWYYCKLYLIIVNCTKLYPLPLQLYQVSHMKKNHITSSNCIKDGFVFSSFLLF